MASFYLTSLQILSHTVRAQLGVDHVVGVPVCAASASDPPPLLPQLQTDGENLSSSKNWQPYQNCLK